MPTSDRHRWQYVPGPWNHWPFYRYRCLFCGLPTLSWARDMLKRRERGCFKRRGMA